MTSVLRLDGVERRYSSNSGVMGIDLEVEQGTTLAIVGPSGSGKSTLLGILGLLDRPSTGSYQFDGLDVGRLSEAARSKLRARAFGFVFQAFHLLSYLTVIENVEVGLSLGGSARSEWRTRANEVIHAVGLAHKAGRLPTELSGGEQQRVAIARALARRPSLLLCDEPTGNLDGDAADQVLRALIPTGGTATRTRTTIIVTHNEDVALQCDRVLTLREGRVIADTCPKGRG